MVLASWVIKCRSTWVKQIILLENIYVLETLQSILYYNLDSSLVKKVEGNLIDHHFDYVYTETNPIVWRYKDFFFIF